MGEHTVESKNDSIQTEKRRFRLCEHPWLSLLAVMVTSVFSIFLAGAVILGLIGLPDDSPTVQFAQGISYHIMTVFVLAPFVLRLPKGKRRFGQYLDDIGLSRVQPLFRLMVLALSCSIILALSQAAASFVYRIFEGQPINGSFVRQVFDQSGDLPPDSPNLLVSIPSVFEEVAFRGIVLTVFLSKYSERKSIIFSSVGFGLMHLLNLAMGRELVWVMGQVAWAVTIGLFYGYVFLRTGSLLPSMMVHYLGNVTIGSLTGYLQSRASVEMQALYGVILSFGVVPTMLMILWARFFSSRCLPGCGRRGSPDGREALLQPATGVWTSLLNEGGGPVQVIVDTSAPRSSSPCWSCWGRGLSSEGGAPLRRFFEHVMQRHRKERLMTAERVLESIHLSMEGAGTLDEGATTVRRKSGPGTSARAVAPWKCMAKEGSLS